MAYSDSDEIVLQNVGAREVMGIKPGWAGDDAQVSALVFSPNGRVLAAASDDGVISLWTVTGKRVVPRCVQRTRLLHRGEVSSMTFSGDGQLLVSGDVEGDVVFWDVGRCRREAAVSENDSAIRDLAFSPNGELVASASDGGLLTIWNSRTRKQVGSRTSHDWLPGIAFTPDGRTLIAAGAPATIKLWEVRDAHALGQSSLRAGYASDVAFSGDGSLLALVRGDAFEDYAGRRSDPLAGTIEIWDVRLRRPVGARIPATPEAHGVALSPDGRIVASAGATDAPDFTEIPQVRLWDVRTRKPLGASVRVGGEMIGELAFSPDGRVLAGAADDRIALWQVPSLKRMADLRTRLENVNDVAFSADGKIVAVAGGEPPTVELWDPNRHERVRMLDAGGPRGRDALDVAFTPDGTTLAALRFDGVIRLWDAATGRIRGDLAGPELAEPIAIAFSDDGRVLASITVVVGRQGGLLHLWDVASESSLGASIPVEGVTTLAFSPGSDLLVSAGSRPALTWWDSVLWSDDLEAFKRRLCPIVGRELTRAEWERFLPDRSTHATCGDKSGLGDSPEEGAPDRSANR